MTLVAVPAKVGLGDLELIVRVRAEPVGVDADALGGDLQSEPSLPLVLRQSEYPNGQAVDVCFVNLKRLLGDDSEVRKASPRISSSRRP